MKFSAYRSINALIFQFIRNIQKALANLQSADTFSEAKQALDALNELRGTIDTAMNLASIRYSIDTNDAFMKQKTPFGMNTNLILKLWIFNSIKHSWLHCLR